MPTISTSNRPASQTKPPANTSSTQMPMGNARDAYVTKLDAHMRAQFATAIQAFEAGGHCQVRVIGLHPFEGELWAPGLLFNYRLPPGPVADDDPHYFRQWAFRLDLPQASSIDLFDSAMTAVLSRLPVIHDTLISLHQTLGYIDLGYKEEAFANHIVADYATLNDATGMQFLLCPFNGATHGHSRLEQGSPPVTAGTIEEWIADWCADAVRMKTNGSPPLTNEFLASLRLADTDGAWFSSHGGQAHFISPSLDQVRGVNVLVMASQVQHHLPLFDQDNRYQMTGHLWFSQGNRVVDAGMLGMEPGLFMTAINLGCNPLALAVVDVRNSANLPELDFNC
jgi:hypothetical protein